MLLNHENNGIYSPDSANVEALKIRNISVIGNLHYQNKKELTSGFGIRILKSTNSTVEGSRFLNTRGGIHLEGDLMKIRNNYFYQVNVGNIYSSGTGISIDGNHAVESGKGSKFYQPRGDSITIGSDSEDVIINNNVLDTGYCYMLWVLGPVKNLTITNNVVRSSVTTGFMIHGGENVVVQGNYFDANLAHGLAFIKGGKNVSIKGNVFNYDSLLISSDLTEVEISDNYFSNIPKGDELPPIKRTV